MLTFKTLGNLGRLGNQMFQYAALCSIANFKQYDFCIPKNNFLTDCFNITAKIDSFKNNNIYPETTFEYDNSFFENCPDNVDIQGFFQTEKYFLQIKDFIYKEYTFQKKYINLGNIYIDRYLTQWEQDKKIALHIRRTDYLTDGNFIKLSLDYYNNALEFFDKKIPVLIFSDDIDWCKEQKLFTSNRFHFINLQNTYVSLFLMTKCNYHVIANSSFSWWGAWLGKSEKTIAPKLWFSGNLEHYNTKDLYLHEWIKI